MPHEDFFRRELVQELRRVENLMRRESSFEKKIYYFSAAYGVTSRTFRYSFSKDILLADFVIQGAYNLLMDRTNRLKAGDKTVPLDDVLFEKISDGLKLLADKIEAKENIQDALEIILTAAYAATGPGNYLREKGDIEL
ncbi:MAG TPA: hypothetical protein VLB04_03305 [Methanotrichaceae archaeon]|nr:hypothetical protein [Methanotrichaceae archaeon]